MVTRTIVRTPRKRKIWANRNTAISISSSQPSQLDDQLDPTFTDLGLSNMSGVTVMRMVGTVALVQGSAGATTPSYINVRLGWAWLDKNLAAASPGDAQIPLPLQNGTRDTRWYHQIRAGALEQAAPVVVGTPLGDQAGGDTYHDVDVTNQHRQRGADQRFMLVIQHDLASEANTVDLRIDLAFLVALP